MQCHTNCLIRLIIYDWKKYDKANLIYFPLAEDAKHCV